MYAFVLGFHSRYWRSVRTSPISTRIRCSFLRTALLSWSLCTLTLISRRQSSMISPPCPSTFPSRYLSRRPSFLPPPRPAGGTFPSTLFPSSFLGSVVSTLQQSVDLLDSYMDDLLTGRDLPSPALEEPLLSVPRVLSATLSWLEQHWASIDLAALETPVDDTSQILDFFRQHGALPPLDGVSAFCRRFDALFTSVIGHRAGPASGTAFPRGTLRGAAGGDAADSRQPARAFGGTFAGDGAAEQAAFGPLFYRGFPTPPRGRETAGRSTDRAFHRPRGYPTSPRSRDFPRGTRRGRPTGVAVAAESRGSPSRHPTRDCDFGGIPAGKSQIDATGRQTVARALSPRETRYSRGYRFPAGPATSSSFVGRHRGNALFLAGRRGARIRPDFSLLAIGGISARNALDGFPRGRRVVVGTHGRVCRKSPRFGASDDESEEWGNVEVETWNER